MKVILAISFCLWAGIWTTTESNLLTSPSSSSSSESNEVLNKLEKLKKLGSAVETKVYVRNVESNMVLEDGSLHTYTVTDEPILTSEKLPEPTWKQVLIIKHRGKDLYYSMAFDRELPGHKIKVVTADGDSPISKIYNKQQPSKALWRFIHIDDAFHRGMYQIVSISSNLALTARNNTNLPGLVERDISDPLQHWDFRDIRTGKDVVFSDDIPCPDGESKDFPRESSRCYAPDTGQNRAAPGNCAGLLQCTSKCIWRFEQCPEGSYYNFFDRKCVSRKNADCGGGIFGEEVKIYIENPKHNKILDDCLGCFGAQTFPARSRVVGCNQYAEAKWYQRIVAKVIRGAYSFAFDRLENEEYKVIVEIKTEGGHEVWSVDANSAVDRSDRNFQWNTVPTRDSQKYQIVSRKTGLALAMTNQEIEVFYGDLKVLGLEMQAADEYNEDQLWTFRKVDSLTGRDIGQYPKSNSSFFLHSSEEKSNVGALLGPSPRSKCRASSQSRQQIPTPNSKCDQANVGRKSSSPNSCKTYLECEPHSCEWQEHPCSGSRYWNNAQKKCVQSQQEATCGAVIFGRGGRVHIKNINYGNSLGICSRCEQDKPLQDQSRVIALNKNARNPVFTVMRRGDDELYSVAFEGKERGGQVKVLTDNGNNEPVAKPYNPTYSSAAQWNFAPVDGKNNAYQIISTASNLALEMNESEDQSEFQVRLVQPDQQDGKQQWQFEDAMTGGLLSASIVSKRHRQIERDDNVLQEY